MLFFYEGFCFTSNLKYVFRLDHGGERVTYRGSKFTNSLRRTKLTSSLGKQQLELWTHTWSGRAPWNRGKFVSQRASSKRFPGSFFFYFWVGRYDWPCRKQRVLFPLDLSVPLAFVSGNAEGLGETKLNVSLGASHPVLIVCFLLKQTNSKPLAIPHLKRMDEVYDLTPSWNSEIKFR